MKVHSRRTAREGVLEALFSHQFSDTERKVTIDRVLENAPDRKDNLDFITLLFNSVLDNVKWADELKRQGCVEFSDIVLQIVNRGHYLEPNISSSRSGGGSSDNKTAGETPDNNDTNWKKNINDNPNADNNKFATSHAALHSLRRYEPDCDGSGKPSMKNLF